MSKMVSPAGEFEVTIQGVGEEKNQIFIEGTFGVWDSKLYFSVEDIAHLVRLMLNLPVILFILRFPFLYLKRRV